MGGVRTLAGIYGEKTEAAVMVDDTTRQAFGPLFEGYDADEQIEEFQNWLRQLPFVALADEIGITNRDLPFLGTDGSDPRMWPGGGLVKVVAYWKSHFLDEDGLLKDAY